MEFGKIDLEEQIPCNSPIQIEYDLDNLQSPRGRLNFTRDKHFRNCLASAPKNVIDVVIVGGGIQGTGMLALLIQKRQLQVLLVSDKEKLCVDFFDRIDKIGQTVLRSGYEHHLAPDGCLQLVDYAKLHADYLTEGEINQIE